MLTPICSSPSSVKRLQHRRGPQQRDTAARDDPLFDRRLGRVHRVLDAAFFSFISVSVAAPTLMIATPPTSLARRSCSFSRS